VTRERLSWLIGLIVTAAVTATLDWASARWTTVASAQTPLGGPRIDVQEKRGLTGIRYGKRVEAVLGGQKGR